MDEREEAERILEILAELAETTKELLQHYPSSSAEAAYCGTPPSADAALSIHAARMFLGVVRVNLCTAILRRKESRDDFPSDR